jgi:hypothetical protein
MIIARAAPLLVLVCATARAVEVESDLSIGEDFVHATTDVAAELHDELRLGAGATLAGTFTDQRWGAQVLVGLVGERLSMNLRAAWAPKQAGRGWLALTPELGLHFALGRLVLDGQAQLTARRSDAHTRRGPVPVDQLQLGGELTATVDERWELIVGALGSFYDPDLAAPKLRGADLGLAVTLAGRPEDWAVVVRGARRVGWLRVELGFTGIAFAADRGTAVVPRAAARVGPFGGLSVEAALDLVLDTDARARDPVRPMGGLTLTWER